MYIKLYKSGRNRIVSENDSYTLNQLSKEGYTVVCDDTGKPEKYSMYGVKVETVVESNKDDKITDTTDKKDTTDKTVEDVTKQ